MKKEKLIEYLDKLHVELSDYIIKDIIEFIDLHKSAPADAGPQNVDEHEQELTNILIDMAEAIELINGKQPYKARAILEHSQKAIRCFMAKTRVSERQ